MKINVQKIDKEIAKLKRRLANLEDFRRFATLASDPEFAPFLSGNKSNGASGHGSSRGKWERQNASRYLKERILAIFAGLPPETALTVEDIRMRLNTLTTRHKSIANEMRELVDAKHLRIVVQGTGRAPSSYARNQEVKVSEH